MRKLQKGSKIAVISPAFPANREKTDKGIKYLKSLGYKVEDYTKEQSRYSYLAETDANRAELINRSFADPEIDAVICSRGGWGTLRFLDLLDYEMIRKNPKPLVGYSDITTLQLAIHSQSGVPSLSGPMVAVEMGSGILDFTAKHFWGLLQNPHPWYTLTIDELEATILHKGMAEGTLIGGCLSLITHNLGTPYAPNFNGAILFIEDIGEETYKMDRYLAHLKHAGVFEQINGLIIGEFLDCNRDEDDFTMDEIIDQYFASAPFPVVKNIPYGHGMKKITMPIGAHTRLDLNSGTLAFENIFL